MKIVVNANDTQFNEFLLKGIPAGVSVSRYEKKMETGDADAFFDLLFEDNGPVFKGMGEQPVFVNSVIKTNSALPSHYIRINAWNGFLGRGILEVVDTGTAFCKRGFGVLESLGWQYHPVPDTPGMISARIIAMIINEAYFGLGEEISKKEEIDIAMKAGTNYPYGPFEWAEKIGLNRIYALLLELEKGDQRYAVAPALEKEIHGS